MVITDALFIFDDDDQSTKKYQLLQWSGSACLTKIKILKIVWTLPVALIDMSFYGFAMSYFCERLYKKWYLSADLQVKWGNS